MAKNQVPEKVPKYRFAVWNVWYKTVHLKVCKIVECEMLGIVCLRIKIALLEPPSPLKPKTLGSQIKISPVKSMFCGTFSILLLLYHKFRTCET